MTISEAASKAKEHLTEVMPELKNETLQLEELEAPPNGTRWRFVFSATPTVPVKPSSLLDTISSFRRVAKSVEIESADGALVAVRNAAA
jgi:hypothetical protein